SSRKARSTRSSERNRCSIIDPLRRLRSLVCTIPRQFPGVICCASKTRYSSLLCFIVMPFFICVAGISTILLPPNLLNHARRMRNDIHHSSFYLWPYYVKSKADFLQLYFSLY